MKKMKNCVPDHVFAIRNAKYLFSTISRRVADNKDYM